MSHSLKHIGFDSAKKTRILRFLNTHSHSPRVDDAGDEPWSMGELYMVLQDIVELVKQEDLKHFQGMQERILKHVKPDPEINPASRV